MTAYKRRPVAGKPLLILVGCALLLGSAQLIASLDRRPLDDPDLAFQRPGFLDAHGAPFLAPKLAPNIPKAGERFILFFVREAQGKPLHDSLMERTHPFDDAVAAVVYFGREPDHEDTVAPFIHDPGGRIAASYRMRRPRDGGAPVGYAIVDSAGLVRYRTLDPTMWKRLDEVQTMWAATP